MFSQNILKSLEVDVMAGSVIVSRNRPKLSSFVRITVEGGRVTMGDVVTVGFAEGRITRKTVDHMWGICKIICDVSQNHRLEDLESILAVARDTIAEELAFISCAKAPWRKITTRQGMDDLLD